MFEVKLYYIQYISITTQPLQVMIPDYALREGEPITIMIIKIAKHEYQAH